VFVDPMTQVKREDLKPEEVVGWAFHLYFLRGSGLAIAVTGGTMLFKDGVWYVATTEFFLGWCAGGVSVLKFFWSKPRRGHQR
jgi:hypothetical protein